MHEHKEKQCKHKLRLCTHCDIVFCLLCEKEWYAKDEYTKEDEVGFKINLTHNH